jgi:hypothetical protein
MNASQISRVYSTLSPAQMARAMVMTAEDAAHFGALGLLGIHLPAADVRAMAEGIGLDDTQGLQTSVSLATPIQFLQTWLPGFVRTMTQARKIDDLIGMQVVGNWEDEEIVQGILEPTASAVMYSDGGNIPLTGWNPAFERRSVIRFEQGLQVGRLEEARAARMRANTAAEKRAAAGLSLDIRRNSVGFLGYNGGNNRTYGFLNDPSLPAYQAAPNGASASPLWVNKQYREITADIRGMVQRLRTATGDQYDPKRDAATLAIATNVVEYLSIVSDYGNSVADWLRETYPAITVKSAPELNAANGGANVAYLYMDEVNDGASDDRRVWSQLVPTKFMTVGVAKEAKGYVEDYSNALGGVMLKRPYAVQRLSGI